jgi:hypothetical protein
MRKTDEQLEQGYNQFIKIINKYFTGERLEKLLFMYSENELGGNLMLSPASGNKGFHNAYDGGYIDHIFNVCKNAIKVKELFVSAGGKIDFTDDELIFAALHHDLGKLGIKGELHYVPNDSKWHIENRGEFYKRNPNVTFMSITDRTFFTLNHYGITYNEKEYFGIKLTDGMFDEDNEKYYRTYDTSKFLKYTIQYVLHWADYMSTIVERQEMLS